MEAVIMVMVMVPALLKWQFTHFWRWLISNDRKKENNAKKFAVDLFVALHFNDKAIFVVILFYLLVAMAAAAAAASCAATNNKALWSVDIVAVATADDTAAAAKSFSSFLL